MRVELGERVWSVSVDSPLGIEGAFSGLSDPRMGRIGLGVFMDVRGGSLGRGCCLAAAV
jgi:hypothetical protein